MLPIISERIVKLLSSLPSLFHMTYWFVWNHLWDEKNFVLPIIGTMKIWHFWVWPTSKIIKESIIIMILLWSIIKEINFYGIDKIETLIILQLVSDLAKKNTYTDSKNYIKAYIFTLPHPYSNIFNFLIKLLERKVIWHPIWKAECQTPVSYTTWDHSFLIGKSFFLNHLHK